MEGALCEGVGLLEGGWVMVIEEGNENSNSK